MADLPKRTLGRTGLEVTTLGFGAMELRGSRNPVTPEQADRVLNTALDAGINYIDTSIDYGMSEDFIGRFVGSRREEYILASKCGCVTGEEPAKSLPGPHAFDREHLIAGVEQSLERLRTDHLDILQLHQPPSMDELDTADAVQTLLDLQSAGKTRFIGISATLPFLPGHLEKGVFDVFQIPYSALDREHEQAISEVSAAGSGVVVRGGVARGVPTEAAKNKAWERFEAAKLDELCGEMTPMELLLRFTLGHPGLDTTIIGTQNPDHVTENVRVAKLGPLPDEVHAEVSRRLDALG